MADFSFAGHPIVNGNVTAAIVGLWHGEFYFSDSEAGISIGQRGSLEILGSSRIGTVVAVEGAGGFYRARIYGGAGKLDTILDPRDYRGYEASAIARDCLRDAGEDVGDWSPLSVSCQHWMRTKDTCRSALRRLCRLTDDASLHWRALASGQISMVKETWPDNTSAIDRENFIWPQERLVRFFPGDGSVSPGQKVTVFGASRRLTRVEYKWSAQEIACEAFYEE